MNTKDSRSFGKVLNYVKNTFRNPMTILIFIISIFLLYLIVIPVSRLVLETFTDKLTKNLTLENWAYVVKGNISEKLFYEPFVHTIGVGISVSILALILGSTLAWIITRTNIPFKKTFYFFMILPYMFPSWFKAFVWLVLFKNSRVGGNPGLIQNVFNTVPPDWLAYGFVPIVLALTSHYYVFAFLLVSAALSSMNTSLEEQAEILGASKFQVLRRITFPLVLPAILSAFILIISKGLGSFSVPAILGLPVRFHTLSTRIYSSIETGHAHDGYILSIILIIVAATIVYINQKVIGKRNYEIIGGKDSRTKLTDLGKWKFPVTFGVWTFVFITSIMPVFILIWQTLMLRSGDYSFSNLTLHHWIGESDPTISNGYPGILNNDQVLSSLKNSLLIALFAALTAAIIGFLIGYITTRAKDSILSKVIDQVSFIPYLIPSIALGAIYLATFTKTTLFLPVLYGSVTLLVLITVVKELPFTTKSGSSTLIQIGGELEEAGKVMGISWIKRFYKIMLPLSRQGLLAGFIIVFISAMKELDLIILLVSPSMHTLATLTFEFQDGGYVQLANAVITLIILIIIVVYFFTTVVGRIDISKGIGGK